MEPNVIALVGVGIAIATFIATHFRTKIIAEIDNRLGKLETKVDLYFDFQERYNAQILHRDDDELKLDRLLEKREQLETLPPEQEQKLDTELEQIIYDKTKPLSLRAAATQMLAARKARSGEVETSTPSNCECE